MCGDSGGGVRLDDGRIVESARDWGRRQAAAAPPWSLTQLRAVAASVGVRLRQDGAVKPEDKQQQDSESNEEM
jgi:hypothetical protein